MKEMSTKALVGAAFLMATSSIGPGFLTQSTIFTQQFGIAMFVIILIVVSLDFITQSNIWRVLVISKMRGQDVANRVLPGLGYFISFLIVLGGLAFNIGNVGGGSLGLNVLFGIPELYGGILTGAIAIFIFLLKNASSQIDRLTKYLASIMILVMLYVVFSSNTPFTDIPNGFVKIFEFEENKLFFAIITLLGGSCGGYITFAGAHRLIDAKIYGKENLDNARRSLILGVCTSGTMRFLLFLAVLGVISGGAVLDSSNPVASAFKLGAGEIGYKIFGLVIFFAALTSVIGAAWTSVSFLKTFSPFIVKHENMIIVAFIAFSTIVMSLIGKPTMVLVVVGTLNGMILPIVLVTCLIAAHKKDIVGDDYKHPHFLSVIGGIVAVSATYLTFLAFPEMINKIFA